MKKLVCLLLVFALAIPAFAEIRITGHAPTVTGTGAGIFNDQTEIAFKEALDQLNDQLKVFESPDNFLQSMGNSSAYASHGATTRGYSGYKLFSATIGLMAGVQLPTGISSMMDDIDRLSDSLEKDGDIKLGLNPNLFNVNVGLNMGIFKFIPENLGIIKRDNLYIGLRVGYFNLSEIELGEDFKFSYNNFTFGVTANYQLIPSISLAGLIVWRGVNIGSGVVYNRSKLNFTIPVDDIRESINYSGYNASIVLKDPTASLDLATNTVIIPLEAITAVKLLFINIPLGIGADLSFGSTSLGAGVTSSIHLEDLPSYFHEDKKGDIAVNGELSNSPSFFNFKIMTGVGFTFGPVVIDIPITFYPASGYNFGVTIGAVW